MFKVIQGDCLDVMKTMADNSVDAIVTDPPYGISFMGKAWDKAVPSVDVWREAIRVLKPGGHILCFAGTRTQHRMACALEDAGFEIRDMLAWTYGSGFTKSHNISKAIDKAAGHDRATEYEPNFKNGTFGKGMGGGKHGAQSEPPVTDAAKTWDGWGTALKPALEPITLARKPFTGTVAANVLAHGTGAINIDGCRVELPDGDPLHDGVKHSGKPMDTADRDGAWGFRAVDRPPGVGRFPANLIHDGSEEVLGVFPQSAGALAPVKKGHSGDSKGIYGDYAQRGDDGATFYGDKGSAARFFYCAKASRKDRGEGNGHPTVKPTALMEYLCRLITPPGGTVLDPFCGSGSTGRGAVLNGFDFIGIELDGHNVEISEARIRAALDKSCSPG